MVAEYLDKHYDRVNSLSRRNSPDRVNGPFPTAVLLVIHDIDPLEQLRHKTTVIETPRGDPFGSCELRRDDPVYRERNESQDDDESPPRQEQEHSV